MNCQFVFTNGFKLERLANGDVLLSQGQWTTVIPHARWVEINKFLTMPVTDEVPYTDGVKCEP